VVDFIDVQWWPVFNVADMAITVGGAILVVGSVLAGRQASSDRNGAVK
jgi:signal peptidase II